MDFKLHHYNNIFISCCAFVTIKKTTPHMYVHILDVVRQIESDHMEYIFVEITVHEQN